MGFTAAGTAPDFLPSAGKAPDSLFIGFMGNETPNLNSGVKIGTKFRAASNVYCFWYLLIKSLYRLKIKKEVNCVWKVRNKEKAGQTLSLNNYNFF